jgi:hypothetical protein
MVTYIFPALIYYFPEIRRVTLPVKACFIHAMHTHKSNRLGLGCLFVSFIQFLINHAIDIISGINCIRKFLKDLGSVCISTPEMRPDLRTFLFDIPKLVRITPSIFKLTPRRRLDAITSST